MSAGWTSRWPRLVGRSIAGLAVLGLLVLACLGLYTRTDHFRLWLREQTLAALRAALNGAITLDQVEGSVWGELRLRHLSVRHNGVEVLAVPQAAVTVRLLPQLLALFRSSTLRLTSLTLTTPVLTLEQEQEGSWNIAHLLKPPDQLQEPQTVRLFFDHIRVEHGRVDLRPAKGKAVQLTALALEGRLALLPAGTQVDITTFTFSLEGAGVPEVQWNGGLAYDSTVAPSLLSLRSTDLRTAHSHLQVSGTVQELSFPSVSLAVIVERLAAADLRQLLPAVPLQQDLSGSVHLTGSLAALQLTATVAAPNGRAIVAGTADLTQTPPSYAGTLEVERFDIDKVLQVANVSGEVKGHLSFAGATLASGQGKLRAQASALQVHGKRIGALDLTGHVANGRVTLTGEAREKDGRVQWQSQITLSRPLAYEATFTVRNFDAAQATGGAPSFPTTMNFDAWVTGKGTHWQEVDLAARLTVLPSRLGPLSIAQGQAVGTLRGTLAGLHIEGQATLSNLRAASRSLHSGTVHYVLTEVGGAQPRGHVTVALNRVDTGMRLRTVTADLALVGFPPAEVQVRCSAQDEGMRTHRLQALVRSAPARLEVLLQELALQMPGGVWRTPQSARLLLQDNRLTIHDLLLQRDNETVSATGTLAWQGAQDLHVHVKRFPLQELRAWVRTGPEVKGQVTAEARVQGTAASPEITVSLTTDELRMAGQPYAGLTAQGVYRQQQLDLNLLLRQDATHTLTLEGGIPLALGWAGGAPAAVAGEANLRARSEGLSLAFLGLLSQEIQDVQGTVSMDVRVRGPAQALTPSGTVQIQQGQARVKPLGLTLTDIGVQIQLAPAALRITQLVARAGEGRLTGSGTLALRQYTIAALDLTLDTDRLRVLNTRQYVATVSGRLVCSGSPQHPLVQGSLTFGDTSARPDFALLRSGPAAADPTIVVVQSASELAAAVQPVQPVNPQGAAPRSVLNNDFYNRLGLDLSVTVPRGTWVHLEEGSIELMGQVRVRKEPASEVLLTGNLETVRGWYAFHGRKFRLEKGIMTFTGATPIDPSLDVVARYTLPRYQVDAVIGGTARTPTLVLTSAPVLEQADILALLLFGRPAGALSAGEKVSFQSQALQAMAGYMAADLRRSVAERLGVDNLEFDVGATLGQSRVGVGKYVAKDVFVSTSQQLGTRHGRELSIEYQLDAQWQLKASTNTAGNNGIDLFWRKRY